MDIQFINQARSQSDLSSISIKHTGLSSPWVPSESPMGSKTHALTASEIFEDCVLPVCLYGCENWPLITVYKLWDLARDSVWYSGYQTTSSCLYSPNNSHFHCRK